MIYFDTKSHGNSGSLGDYANKLSASSYLYESLDIKRMINWVEIIDLEPNTSKNFIRKFPRKFLNFNKNRTINFKY